MSRFSALIILAGCTAQSGSDVQIQAAEGEIGDLEAPTIIISSPERGDWSGEGSVTVTGRFIDPGRIASATINGRELPVPGTRRIQAFDAPVPLTAGVNTITLTATDVDGNTAESRISVMGGQTRGADFSVRRANVMELNGPMMDMLAEPLGNNMGGRDLITESVDKDVWSDCAVFEGAVDSIVLGDAIVSVTPGEDGLSVTASFSLTAEYTGIADVCGIEEAFAVDLSHANPFYTATVSLSAVEGVMTASIDESSVDLTGASMTSNLDEDLALHDLTLADMGIDEAIAAMITASVDATLPQSLPTAIGALIPDDIGIESAGLMEITYNMERIRTDADGIGIAYSAEIPEDENAVNVAPGAVHIPIESMTRHTDAPFVSNSSLNLINKAIHSAWESGILGAYVNAEDKGISINAWPTMPPVVHPGESTVMALGELHVSLYEEEDLLTRYSVQATAELSFDADKAGNPTMVATLSEWHGTLLDGVENAELDSEIEEAIQATFDAAMPRLAQQQSAAASLEAIGSEVTGDDNDWVTISYLTTDWK